MINIRYADFSDKPFWFSLDKHLAEEEFIHKINLKRAYIIELDNSPIGILRYNLFWDSIPFCTLLFIDFSHHKKGYGKKLIKFWEADMKNQGFDLVITSTQIDEDALHFYRYLGYEDAGGLLLNSPKYKQPMELFLTKEI